MSNGIVSNDYVEKTLKGFVSGLDREIAWREDDLLHTNEQQLQLRTDLSALRQKRRKLLDHLEVHFGAGQ